MSIDNFDQSDIEWQKWYEKVGWREDVTHYPDGHEFAGKMIPFIDRIGKFRGLWISIRDDADWEGVYAINDKYLEKILHTTPDGMDC